MQKHISTLIGIIIIVAVAVVSFGGVFAYQKYFVPIQPNQTVKVVELRVWPDVNSFNMSNKSFEAKGVYQNVNIKKIKINTNNLTKISSQDTSTSISDFQGMYSMMKNWIGPEWWFTAKGNMQNDGSLIASEIFIRGQ
jgi:hypothetical protein